MKRHLLTSAAIGLVSIIALISNQCIPLTEAQTRGRDLLIDVSATDAARVREGANRSLTSRDVNSGVLRSRVVRLNQDVLRGLSDRSGSNIIRFNLFNDPNDQVIYEGVLQSAPTGERTGITVSTGRLQLPAEPGRAEQLIPDSNFTMVSESGLVAFNITAPEGVFQIAPISGGLYLVEQVDPSAQFKDAAIQRPPKRTAEAARERVTRDDGRQVDVMVVYTTRAREHFGSTQAIEIRADLAAQLTNEAFTNSGIDLKVRIVHKQEIPWFVESYGFGYTLDRISDDPEVNRLRNLHHADQVTLIRYGGDMWGVAYMLSALDPAYESLAFSEIDSGHVANYYVFSHELGHNFGCAHDIDNIDVWGLYSYSIGYAFNTPHHGFVGTVMSYRGDRILYYSNPDVLYDGVPTGVVGKKDNARTIRNSKLLVCNYRQGAP